MGGDGAEHDPRSWGVTRLGSHSEKIPFIVVKRGRLGGAQPGRKEAVFGMQNR